MAVNDDVLKTTHTKALLALHHNARLKVKHPQ